MGTWSHETFGNDTACDWAAIFVEGDSLRPIEAAVAAVIDHEARLLDAHIAEEALAASEVIARLRGHPGHRSPHTEALDAWVQRTRLQPPASLVTATLAAIDRIACTDSELRALWAETDDEAKWLAAVADLRVRVGAAPRDLGPVLRAEPAADRVTDLVHRVQKLRFELVPLPDSAPVNALYQQALGGGALGDHAAVRDAIERLWQPIAWLGKPTIAWDLAVRDAQTLAAEGRLDEALDDLEAWRASVTAREPGMFAMRAAGVCQAGGDTERSATLRDEAVGQAPHQIMWRLDGPLLEARAGSVDVARAQLDALGDPGSDAALGGIHRFIRGILACRGHEPTALALLTPVAEDYAGKCLNGAAGWSLASTAIGWWALALAQAGREFDARAVTEALRPVLLQAHNSLLIRMLRDARVLPDETPMPERPRRQAFAGRQSADHGAFTSVALRGVHALEWLESQRRRFSSGSGPWPFLIGDDEDLRRLLGMISPPADGGRSVIDVAADIEAAAWLKEHASGRKLAWPREAPKPIPTLLSQFSTTTQRLKPTLHVGLVDVTAPEDLFARLGWGDWNDCPGPAVHVALHRHWREQFGAEPVAVSGDVVECAVARPPDSRPRALALASAQAGYCPDIVEQGVGTVARLGASLLLAPYWFFWWD